MPIELAHGLQVMQMCEAFSEFCEVKLLVPRRINPIKEDVFSYYNLQKKFQLKKIPCLDLIFVNGKNIFFWIQTLTFLFFTKIYLLFKKFDILYTREQMTALFFNDFVLEIHLLPRKIRRMHLYIWGKARKLVVLTPFIKERLIKLGVPERKIMIAPDGVKIPSFDISLSREDARKKLNLPQDKKLIGYVGMLRTLGMEKGIDAAIEAMSLLKSENIKLVLVGGYEADINFYKKIAEKFGIKDKIIFTGRVNHSLIPIYLKSFDILIAPFPENEHYSFYMSPMKIFEYMASKRPIICTKLPSLEFILKDSAFFIKPGDSPELAVKINEILENAERGENLAQRAYNYALEYSWENRAKNILSNL